MHKNMCMYIYTHMHPMSFENEDKDKEEILNISLKPTLWRSKPD